MVKAQRGSLRTEVKVVVEVGLHNHSAQRRGYRGGRCRGGYGHGRAGHGSRELAIPIGLFVYSRVAPIE
ncbi:hypothetical protein GOBAR_AA09478 [Gossypium barbadense]|uniref:Uncharacterized protein n=1 Tax=Gossypium barbadense TaxID=3634 RepID=A0A2P5Y6E4_GOSBA|nr:hypothetical protein GOBAR_AA09478 [Gossypium barbadense]